MRTIAWDVDDVLNELMRVWLETWWRPAHPECPVGFDELTENPPHRLLGISHTDYLASLDSFRLSEPFARLVPRPEVLAWFERHGASYRHLALTAVPLRCAPASAAWVLQHFGRWLRSFHVIPSPRSAEAIPAYDRSKEDFLRRTGSIDLLIDDNPAHILGAERAGVQGLLFPAPWNKSRETLSRLLELLPSSRSVGTHGICT
jgi:hypothetical protein